MARDPSFARRQLARAFIEEACRLKRNPPGWSSLSEEQTEEYLSRSMRSLRAQLLFHRERIARQKEGSGRGRAG